MATQFIKVIAVTACLPAMALAASYAPGAGTDFSFSNASDLNGNFGQPIAAGNDLFFPFMSFSASANGANPSVSTTDTISLDLLANAGLRFDAIGFLFMGTRTINGTPGNNTVQSDGSLTVTGLTGDPFAGFDSFAFFDDQPASGSPWSGGLSVLIPLGTQVTELNVSLSHELIAVATDGDAQITTSFDIAPGIFLSVIPEPSSLALLAVSGLATLRRRGRKN